LTISEGALAEILNKISTLSKQFPNIDELLLAYLKGPTWLQKEPAFIHISGMPAKLPRNAWIELISDESCQNASRKYCFIKLYIERWIVHE